MPALQTSSPPTQASQAAGMVNPPRKAKRLRELVSREHVAEPALPTSPLPQSPQRAPSPTTVPAAPRPRGRKPAGPMSRAAREQLRKTNHSVIEKRRREKINEALAALRELVPNDKPDGEEKEFKLEVLVRTVEYLRMMVTRVRKLEEQTCVRCGGSLAVTEPSNVVTEGRAGVQAGKRKRLAHEDIVADDSISGDEGVTYLPPTPVHRPDSSSFKSSPSLRPLPQLPSISSWLLSSPTESPTLDPHVFQRPSPPHPFQLPSPPQSTPFAPKNSPGFLPRLSLPPGIQLPTSPGVHARADTGACSLHDRHVSDTVPLERGQGPVRVSIARSNGDRRASGSGSPSSPWTRDDQTAASLLLNISSRRAGEAPPRGVRDVVLEAQTPSSVLGMIEG